MLQKFMISTKPWQKLLFYMFVFTLSAVSVLVFMLCIAAFAIIRIDTPEYVLIPLTTILLTASSFLNSFLLGKVYRENGLLLGLANGLIYSLIIISISVFYQCFDFTDILLTKIAAVFFSGILGGILGVNS